MRRIIFLGQKPVGGMVFDLLLQSAECCQVVGVVSNADTDTWWGDNHIWRQAGELGLPRLSNKHRNEAGLATMIEDTTADTILSVQHNWIISSQLLDAVGEQAFNLHLAPLPAYRGYNSFSHAILDGASSYGVTLHRMAPEVDHGDIAFATEFPIKPSDTARSLYDRSIVAGAALVSQLVDCWRDGRAIPRLDMGDGGRFYAKQDLNKLREITANDSGEIAERKARAFSFPPFPPAFRMIDGRRVNVLSTQTH